MQWRVPCHGMVELADLERQRAGLCAPFAPDRAPRDARNRVLAIDVDTVEAAAFKCAADRSEMREQVGVLDDDGNVSDMKIAASKGRSGMRNFSIRAPVEAKMLEVAGLRAARRDHGARTIDADHLESIADQQPSVR